MRKIVLATLLALGIACAAAQSMQPANTQQLAKSRQPAQRATTQPIVHTFPRRVKAIYNYSPVPRSWSSPNYYFEYDLHGRVSRVECDGDGVGFCELLEYSYEGNTVRCVHTDLTEEPALVEHEEFELKDGVFRLNIVHYGPSDVEFYSDGSVRMSSVSGTSSYGWHYTFGKPNGGGTPFDADGRWEAGGLFEGRPYLFFTSDGRKYCFDSTGTLTSATDVVMEEFKQYINDPYDRNSPRVEIDYSTPYTPNGR